MAELQARTGRSLLSIEEAAADDRIDFSIDYSVDELAALADLLEVSSFPGVEGLFEGVSEEVREATLASAARSVLARGVVRVVDEQGTIEVTQPHAALMSVVLAPDIVISVQRQSDDEVEARRFYADPELAIEQIAVADTMHRFSAMNTDRLVRRALEVAELRTRPRPEGKEFRATLGAIAAIGIQDSTADLPPEFAPFVAALETHVCSARVECLSRRDGNLAGGEVTWVDGGENGLWLIEPAAGEALPEDDDATPLTVRPVDAEAIVDEILGYLPQPEDAPA